jgi:hypothetical protein
MGVRLEGNNGHDADVSRCLRMTHVLLPRGSHSPDHRQSFRITLEFEVGALYGLTIEVHVKRLSRLDRES